MSEKTIMLCCAAGMSTSMLVKRMQDAANEKGIDAKIFACPAAEVDEKLKQENVNSILLGPQVRYLLDNIKKKVEGKPIKVDVIDMQAYGMMNGAKVLEQGLKLID
ncbi:PTS system, cellobiose-specific IIB component [Liquorilactobacillus sucicola DSM 21376 = JCM 15457]|uniref:PTS system, lactose cellobiose-specific IIB subunit n=1 Tax=Liquorilactobacillus sucicola DSM 21376 = JCM 15457 TaxID=1423806 RepID=A0A023CY73_9LACO|nr:PTS sugar transporter subunit IIB [Liquorilactobacillus sucicola]KRN07523.1 PTS system, lactose cellobiose-specific IIB subunit [Liquorilactobacillus sucicola DSM 21376 = JCM 15457]GAJ26848.1 PTS system, cellobiose-specific IIB component [Liquorilactobacillus sucicola DSM 21376 = JCM 15457]